MPGRTGTGVSQDRTGQDADTDHSARSEARGAITAGGARTRPSSRLG